MEAMLTGMLRIALWGLLLALFLLNNAAGNRVMVVAVGEAPAVEISATGIATDAPGSNRGMGQCANIANCATHVGNHCLTVDFKQCELAISHQPIESKSPSASTNTVASIDFPTGLFRPPIV